MSTYEEWQEKHRAQFFWLRFAKSAVNKVRLGVLQETKADSDALHLIPREDTEKVRFTPRYDDTPAAGGSFLSHLTLELDGPEGANNLYAVEIPVSLAGQEVHVGNPRKSGCAWNIEGWNPTDVFPDPGKGDLDDLVQGTIRDFDEIVTSSKFVFEDEKNPQIVL